MPNEARMLWKAFHVPGSFVTAGHNRLLWIPTPPHLAAIYKPVFFPLSHFHLSSFLVERQLCQRLSGLTDHNKQVNLPRHRVRLVPEHFGVFFSSSPLHALIAATECHSRGAEHRATARGPQNLSVNKGLKESMRRICPVFPSLDSCAKLWKTLRRETHTHTHTGRLVYGYDWQQKSNEWMRNVTSAKVTKELLFPRGCFFFLNIQLFFDILDNKRGVH